MRKYQRKQERKFYNSILLEEANMMTLMTAARTIQQKF